MIKVVLCRRVSPADPYSAIVPLDVNDVGQIEMSMWPSDTHMELDYAGRTDGQPVYQGMSAPGTAFASADWLLFKYEYDVSNRLVTRTVARDAWNNRATTAVYT